MPESDIPDKSPLPAEAPHSPAVETCPLRDALGLEDCHQRLLEAAGEFLAARTVMLADCTLENCMAEEVAAGALQKAVDAAHGDV